ncbi:MAG: hypothetical protein ACYTGH_12950 [Planctomycetota bacterium]
MAAPILGAAVLQASDLDQTVPVQAPTPQFETASPEQPAPPMGMPVQAEPTPGAAPVPAGSMPGQAAPDVEDRSLKASCLSCYAHYRLPSRYQGRQNLKCALCQGKIMVLLPGQPYLEAEPAMPTAPAYNNVILPGETTAPAAAAPILPAGLPAAPAPQALEQPTAAPLPGVVQPEGMAPMPAPMSEAAAPPAMDNQTQEQMAALENERNQMAERLAALEAQLAQQHDSEESVGSGAPVPPAAVPPAVMPAPSAAPQAFDEAEEDDELDELEELEELEELDELEEEEE